MKDKPLDGLGGAVLCGGASSRMGVDKAMLKLGELTLLEIVSQKLSAVCDPVWLLADRQERYASLGLPAAVDIVPNAGPLSSILTALTVCEQPYVFVAACDLPFIKTEMIEALYARRSGVDAVVPRVDGRYEPTFALYSRSCAPVIRANLDSGERRVHSLFEHIKAAVVEEPALRRIDPELLSFFNLNTPEDYERARQLYSAGHSV